MGVVFVTCQTEANVCVCVCICACVCICVCVCVCARVGVVFLSGNVRLRVFQLSRFCLEDDAGE